MTQKKLNVGCGKDIRSGWINLDAHQLPGVDIVHDIEKEPLPFEDNTFDFVLCRNILEHIEYIPVMKELHRIMKSGGSLIIRVPHFTSRRNFDDPTHKKMFSIRTFDYFVKNSRMQKDYYFDFHFTKITHSRILFEKKWYIYNHLVEWFINASKKLRETFYEATCISRLFPADNIIIKLVK